MRKEYNTHHVNFNRSVRIRFNNRPITSDAGYILLRELEDKLGLTESLARQIEDFREAGKVDHSVEKLLRQRIFSLAQGYRDQNDAEALRRDPALAVAASDHSGERALDNEPASQPTMSRLNLGMLAFKVNLDVLRKGLLEWTRRYLKSENRKKLGTATIDLDSSVHEVHGDPDGAEYNGHYRCKGYHPLYGFLAEKGLMLKATLRPGNVHSSKGAADFLMPLIEQVKKGVAKRVRVRGDAAFALPELMDALENCKKPVKDAFRISSNPRLEALAEPYLKELDLEPGDESFFEFTYKADTWSHPRRVVMVVIQEWELFPRHFFIVTNFTKTEKNCFRLLDFYRQRGTFESWLGEFKSTLRPRFPSEDMPANEANFLMFCLAYNLMRIMSFLGRPDNETIPRLDTVRERLLKVGGALVRSGRRLIFDLAQAAHSWLSRFFGRLARLKPVPI